MFCRFLTIISLIAIFSPAIIFSAPKQTFLDTLNRGRELSLAPFTTAEKKQPEKESLKTSQYKDKKLSVIPNGFRIQILASSSMDAIKKKKTELEENIMLPLYIAFNDPYYKLLAGNFTSRDDAERELEKIKKTGYPDAWIISSDVLK